MTMGTMNNMPPRTVVFNNLNISEILLCDFIYEHRGQSAAGAIPQAFSQASLLFSGTVPENNRLNVTVMGLVMKDTAVLAMLSLLIPMPKSENVPWILTGVARLKYSGRLALGAASTSIFSALKSIAASASCP